MKKYAIMTLFCTVTCLSVFADSTKFSIHAKNWETSPEDIRVVNLCNLTENDLKEAMQGLHPNVAVEFLANTTLPIDCYLKGDLINLVEDKDKRGTVEIKQTFYARCIDKELLFSSDLTEWKPLLEFITGKASVALHIQDGQTSLVIGTETSQRL